jgi:TPR repeat protein
MSVLQRFAFRRDPGKEAQLAHQVTTLQATLAKCKDMARRSRRLRRTLIGLTGVLMLGIGFLLGVYREPIGHSVARVFVKRSDAEAGYAAYRKGDYESALRILRPLAESGEARAQFNLGVMYSEGQGVPQDYTEAGKWYGLSAWQGYAQAQYNLGLWYAQGEGGAQDYIRAHMWFNLAAASFPPSDILSRSAAIKNRDTIASRMSSDQIAQAQRLARDWQPRL